MGHYQITSPKDSKGRTAQIQSTPFKENQDQNVSGISPRTQFQNEMSRMGN